MIENKTDFERVTDLGNLYKAYKKSKSGKKFSRGSQRFQVAALDGVLQIKRRLETKTYKISEYNEFTIYEPKERIIKAGSFVDKITQHSLCDYVLFPLSKNEFISTNYAGQLGKGTLYGLNCLKKHMLLAYEKYGYNCWIIKADVSKFFYNIDHDILKDIVQYFVKDDDVYWLCEKFIDSTDGLGLPLGNQSSLIFALLYLSGLDHFATGELGVEFYGRYSDDFYMIVHSREYAKWCLESIVSFTSSLGLNLNGKTQIIPFKNGIKFCGFHTYVTERGKVIRKLSNENKRSKKKKYKRMAYLVRKGKLSKEKFHESYSGWKNHISNGNCIKFGYEMDKYITELLKD